MTELRKRMIESLQLRGLSERTQECYLRAVRQLAEHYHKSPDLISEQELRDYFLFLINVKKWSRPSTTIALCGIKFFFEYTLNRPLPILSLVRPAPKKNFLSSSHSKKSAVFSPSSGCLAIEFVLRLSIPADCDFRRGLTFASLTSIAQG
jgi:hypothetical protein